VDHKRLNDTLSHPLRPLYGKNIYIFRKKENPKSFGTIRQGVNNNLHIPGELLL